MFNHIKLTGLTEFEANNLRQLAEKNVSKDKGPMYNSASKGLIPIASMNGNHRMNAAKAILRNELTSLGERLSQAQSFEDIYKVYDCLVYVKDEDTLQNLLDLDI